MLAIDGQDGGMVLLCQLQNQLTSHHQRFLIGQCNGLAGLDGMDGRRQTSKAHHGCQHHVNRVSLYDFVQGLLAGIHLHVGHVTHQLFQLVQSLLVGNNDSSRLELMRLLSQQLHFVVGGQAIYFIQITMLLDDFKCLCAYRPCRA